MSLTFFDLPNDYMTKFYKEQSFKDLYYIFWAASKKEKASIFFELLAKGNEQNINDPDLLFEFLIKCRMNLKYIPGFEEKYNNLINGILQSKNTNTSLAHLFVGNFLISINNQSFNASKLQENITLLLSLPMRENEDINNIIQLLFMAGDEDIRLNIGLTLLKNPDAWHILEKWDAHECKRVRSIISYIASTMNRLDYTVLELLYFLGDILRNPKKIDDQVLRQNPITRQNKVEIPVIEISNLLNNKDKRTFAAKNLTEIEWASTSLLESEYEKIFTLLIEKLDEDATNINSFENIFSPFVILALEKMMCSSIKLSQDKVNQAITSFIAIMKNDPRSNVCIAAADALGEIANFSPLSLKDKVNDILDELITLLEDEEIDQRVFMAGSFKGAMVKVLPVIMCSKIEFIEHKFHRAVTSLLAQFSGEDESQYIYIDILNALVKIMCHSSLLFQGERAQIINILIERADETELPHNLVMQALGMIACFATLISDDKRREIVAYLLNDASEIARIYLVKCIMHEKMHSTMQTSDSHQLTPMRKELNCLINLWQCCKSNSLEEGHEVSSEISQSGPSLTH